jgi:hypothetical protein
MARPSPLAGPGGILTVLALAWFTAAGVLLAWLVPSGSEGALRGLLTRLMGG